jgi:hypothetical protein
LLLWVVVALDTGGGVEGVSGGGGVDVGSGSSCDGMKLKALECINSLLYCNSEQSQS